MVDKLIITEETPSDVIERDISDTRSEISGTLNEIMERFSINHFKEEAKDKIISSLRTIPVAVRMAALGVGAVMLMLIVLKKRKKTKMPGGAALPLMKEARRKTIRKVKQSSESGMEQTEFKKAA